MTSSQWHNVLVCASARKREFGDGFRWPSRAHYERYQREYDTFIMAGAMGARTRRLASQEI